MRIKILLASLCLTFISATSETASTSQFKEAWYTYNEAPNGNRCSNDN